jgi:hypothetical protein
LIRRLKENPNWVIYQLRCPTKVEFDSEYVGKNIWWNINKRASTAVDRNTGKALDFEEVLFPEPVIIQLGSIFQRTDYEDNAVEPKDWEVTVGGETKPGETKPGKTKARKTKAGKTKAGQTKVVLERIHEKYVEMCGQMGDITVDLGFEALSKNLDGSYEVWTDNPWNLENDKDQACISWGYHMGDD